MELDELFLISFLGLYLLFVASFIYNFYLSKRIYTLLENIGVIIALTAEIKTRPGDKKEGKKEGTMKRLIREGMELEKAAFK